MLTRIAVGIDGAEGGDDALAFALALARPATRIDLVTAIPCEMPMTSSSASRSMHDLLFTQACEQLQALVGDDERLRPVVESDRSPGRALHEHAADEQADLIVVGRTHHRAAGRVLLGDISRTTLHGAPCPVAVAPPGYRERSAPIRVIAVACTDRAETRVALDFAADIAATCGATLHLVTAFEPPTLFSASYAFAPHYSYDWEALEAQWRDGARRLLSSLAADLPDDTTTTVLEGRTDRVLEDLSEQVDVLVAGSRGWGTAKSVILGSTTDRLVHHAACPVIVVPRPAVGEIAEDTVHLHDAITPASHAANA